MNFLISSMASGLIHTASGAGILAAAVTDGSAYGGERIFRLDELQRVQIFSLGSHFDIALHRKMGRQEALQGAVPVS